jgi:hypothetical protein
MLVVEGLAPALTTRANKHRRGQAHLPNHEHATGSGLTLPKPSRLQIFACIFNSLAAVQLLRWNPASGMPVWLVVMYDILSG